MLSFDVEKVVKRLTFMIVTDSELNFRDVQNEITERLKQFFDNLGMEMNGISNVIILLERGDNTYGMQALNRFLNDSIA